MSNPNRSPAKGFIKELAKDPIKPVAKREFKYDQRLTPESSVSLNTPRRLTEYKRISAPASNIVKETALHIKNRGTK